MNTECLLILSLAFCARRRDRYETALQVSEPRCPITTCLMALTSLQVTEEDILSNNEESQEFVEFLSVLGETVQLQGFTG